MALRQGEGMRLPRPKIQSAMKLVEVFISRLRRKIDSPPLIHTVRHLGYTIREEQ